MKFSEYQSKQNEGKKEEGYAGVEKTYNELKGKSKDELSKMLEAEVKRQKQNGTFNKEGLLTAIEMLNGYVSQEQIEEMRKMLGSL